MARVNDYELPLSDDELTAIALQAQGYSRYNASKEMEIPEGTYIHMLRRVYLKTGTSGAAPAIAILMARGDLRPEHIFGDDADRPWGGDASNLIHVRLLTELNADKLPGLGDAYQALMRKGL